MNEMETSEEHVALGEDRGRLVGTNRPSRTRFAGPDPEACPALRLGKYALLGPEVFDTALQAALDRNEPVSTYLNRLAREAMEQRFALLTERGLMG
jgi:hypothetical protein